MADMRNDRYDRYRTQRRQVEFRDEPGASTSPARGSRGTARRPQSQSDRSHASSSGTAPERSNRSAQPARGSQPARRNAAPRYSESEIRRNRIIALAVLAIAAVIVIALLANLVSCMAHALGGGAQDGGESTAMPQVEETSGGGESSQQFSTQALASNEGVEDPWVEGGRFATGDAELDEMVKQICDENSKEGASAADNAFSAYCAVVWSDYVENDENQHPTGPDWDIEYAKQMFRNNAGNCYEFAAADEFVLKYFGYQDVYAEPCLVYRESGSYGDHGLTFATDFEGRKCMCDSSFGANGWLIDADSYTMQVVDVGQDSSEFGIADFEKVAEASWA